MELVDFRLTGILVLLGSCIWFPGQSEANWCFYQNLREFSSKQLTQCTITRQLT